MKRFLPILMAFLFVITEVPCRAEDRSLDGISVISLKEEKENTIALSLTAESALLMEATTGKIIYENNADVEKPPASVTKIMTMLLIFEDLANGKIVLTDEVTVSPYAASMGGSQVFLEAGEVQTVDTLLKCIAVSSANDGCVAMAEYISGSEEAFVSRMNEKAKELGMEHTHFVNCCGLDAEGHETTARDIALMSRELTGKYPAIFDYTTIWMDEFTHKTNKGESVFGLSSTNKLLKQYPGCNGLKTGSTSKAKFCISATATRNKVSLIAVVMACPDSKSRIRDISTLFDYGFANVAVYEDENPLDDLLEVDVAGGKRTKVRLKNPGTFSTALLKDDMTKEITKKVRLLDPIQAPVGENEILGEIEYQMDGDVIGTLPIQAMEKIEKMTYLYAVQKVFQRFVRTV